MQLKSRKSPFPVEKDVLISPERETGNQEEEEAGELQTDQAKETAAQLESQSSQQKLWEKRLPALPEPAVDSQAAGNKLLKNEETRRSPARTPLRPASSHSSRELQNSETPESSTASPLRRSAGSEKVSGILQFLDAIESEVELERRSLLTSRSLLSSPDRRNSSFTSEQVSLVPPGQLSLCSCFFSLPVPCISFSPFSLDDPILTVRFPQPPAKYDWEAGNSGNSGRKTSVAESEISMLSARSAPVGSSRSSHQAYRDLKGKLAAMTVELQVPHSLPLTRRQSFVLFLN